ncbi:MAG: XdhC family protein, partial [Syntrophomonadaceae bacterium]|nr:XdhC family protein [Syntrophomonadaceae bacterium]
RETIYNSLLEEGYSRDDLERVHSPIGLPIQAESPEEIAVSITAEMIQVRAGLGSGKSSKCPER